MEKKTVSLTDLNLKTKCADGFTFPFLDDEGKETGIKFTVLGAHAPAVQKWVNGELNARRKLDAMQAKRGKDVDVRNIEDDIEFGVELMAIRIIGWEGITEPYSPENALQLCETNPLVVEQVKQASETLANFTRKA